VSAAWRIRRAGPEDAGALGKILSDWIDATSWMPQLYSREGNRSFVAGLIDGVEVLTEAGARGFIACESGEVRALYLAPEVRGRGLGSALLAGLGDRALTLWTFEANTGAIAFYRRAGFVEIARSDGARNEENLPDIRFACSKARGGVGPLEMGWMPLSPQRRRNAPSL